MNSPGYGVPKPLRGYLYNIIKQHTFFDPHPFGRKAMPYWRLYYHLVWTTKKRLPLLTPEIESWLFPYLKDKTEVNGGIIYAVNGWHDHIHIACSIPPKLSISQFVKSLKGSSSYDIKERGITVNYFAWQESYNVFTVSEKTLARIVTYVKNQKEHHQKGTTISFYEPAENRTDK
jgi:putative transposase